MQYRFIQVKLQEDEFLLVKVTAALLNESLNSLVKRILIKECATTCATNAQDLLKINLKGEIDNDNK